MRDKKELSEGSLRPSGAGEPATSRRPSGAGLPATSEATKKEYMKLMATELHKPYKKRYHRRHVYVLKKDEVWSMDLVDMSEWADENNNYKWILNAVDVFTRYAFSRPIKSKSAKDVFDAFADIVKTSKRKPEKIWVDEGKEFYNAEFKKWLKSNNAIMYSSHGDHKSMIVERFNRTLKTNMWKLFTENNDRTWIDKLDDLIRTYNSTRHRFLKMTPAQASLPQHEAEIRKRSLMAQDEEGKDRQSKYQVNDIVRLSRVKGKFEKGYLPNWSRAQYKIVEVTIPFTKTEPLTYKLADSMERPVEGAFYEDELQSVHPKLQNVYLIEEVLQTRKRNGRKEFFVKWLGYDKKENSWIKESDVAYDFDR